MLKRMSLLEIKNPFSAGNYFSTGGVRGSTPQPFKEPPLESNSASKMLFESPEKADMKREFLTGFEELGSFQI